MDEEVLRKRQAYHIRLLIIWFLYTTFSGAIRKWVLTDPVVGNLMLGIQIGAPLLFVLLARTKPLDSFIINLMIAFSLLLTLMAFNPLAISLGHGAVGYFLHTGVFFPLLTYLNDREAFPVERLNRLFVLIILIEVALGFIQFLAPSDSILNKYVRDMSEFGGIAKLGGIERVRITGTFSYIGGLTSLFTVVGFWIWGLRLVRKSAVWIVVLLICCGTLSPMTGSRGLAALLVILIGCGFLSTLTEVRGSVGLAFLGGVVLLVLQFTNVSLVGEAYTGLSDRVREHQKDGENKARIVGQLEEIIDFQGDYPLFGTGLGATYQGAIALFGESRALKDYGYYEEEPERVILEGGFLLFVVRLLFWWIIFRRSAIPLLFSVMLIFLHLFFQVTVFNVFTAFYTVLGIMYLDRCYWLRQQSELV